MAKAVQRKKRYTTSDLKMLFGSDFRMLTDAEMTARAAKPVSLQKILPEIKKRPEKAGDTSRKLAHVRKELQKLLGRLEKIEKSLMAN